MPSAITAASSLHGAPTYSGARPSPAALQARLERFQQQLSDCVNCASANTPQGKADISAIASRISQVQKSIAEIDGGKDARAAALAPSLAADSNVKRGGRVDVFA